MTIVGILSFPRSGNRWMRNIVAASLGGSMMDIPDLHQASFSGAKDFNGIKAFKFHAGTYLKRYKEMDADMTHVIHIRRHPLDVFVSYVNYKSNKVSGNAIIPYESIDSIAGTDLFDIYFDSFILHGHIERPAFYQLSKDYFSHNDYWISEAKRNSCIHCLKYEDIMIDPIGALSFLPKLLGVDTDKVVNALKTAEDRTPVNGGLVWRKKMGGFSDYLTEAQINRFAKFRREDCQRLGYEV